MRYYNLSWNHKWPDCPYQVYMELDDNLNQLKVLELFGSGEIHYATNEIEHGTFLAKEPFLEPEEINILNDREEITVSEITQKKFNYMWCKYINDENG